MANGVPLQKIADTLNEFGYRTQTGRKFTKNSFDGWASNKKYIGIYTWDVKAAKADDGKRNNYKHKPKEEQTIIPDAIPTIIDKELFEKVNALMDSRKRTGARMRAKVNYLLTGKIVCGQCGASYEGNSYRSKGKLFSYYRCKNKCGNTSLRKDDIKSQVVDALIQYFHR